MLICRDKIGARLLAQPNPNTAVAAYLTRLLEPAYGEVLDISFGTGAHLPFYPASVNCLTCTASGLDDAQDAHAALQNAGVPYVVVPAALETLPFEDDAFDTVVSLLTLCSADALEASLRELRRVLKPGGSFIFLEHGLSDDPQIARWQNLLNPLATLLPHGCYLNREMARLIRAAGFTDFDLLSIEGHGMKRLDSVILAGRASPDRKLSAENAGAATAVAA